MRILPAMLFAAGIIFYSSATAQETIHFEAKDGTSADVTLISTNPDEGRNSSIYLGFFGPEGMNNIGFSTYKPAKYYISAVGGLTGGTLDASYFFTTKVKESSISNSLKGSGNVTYVGKIPLEKRTAVGIHGGAGYTDYSFMNTSGDNAYSTMSGFGGITVFKAKHINMYIDESKRKGARNGTLLMRLNADAIFYFNQKFIRGTYVNPGPDDDISTMARTIGFRVYVDGKATMWGRKGRLSLNYMLGVGRNSDLKRKLPAIGGMGFGYNF
jgi:hypothetical protein